MSYLVMYIITYWRVGILFFLLYNPHSILAQYSGHKKHLCKLNISQSVLYTGHSGKERVKEFSTYVF